MMGFEDEDEDIEEASVDLLKVSPDRSTMLKQGLQIYFDDCNDQRGNNVISPDTILFK